MFKRIILLSRSNVITKQKLIQQMKKLNAIIAMLFVAGTVSAQTTWTVDKAHSKLGFSITHLMISEVDGLFKSFDAKITSSKEDFSDAVVELTADVNTIDTDNEGRDGHLKSEDFFDAAKFPSFSFKSTSFTKVADKKYKVAGNLTLRGITKPVELEATLGGTMVDPRSKKTVAGFKVTGTIKRSDFGIGSSGPGLGDEVMLNAKTEFKN
jgi:polyisoprenoid-binding protein YceI